MKHQRWAGAPQIALLLAATAANLNNRRRRLELKKTAQRRAAQVNNNRRYPARTLKTGCANIQRRAVQVVIADGVPTFVRYIIVEVYNFKTKMSVIKLT